MKKAMLALVLGVGLFLLSTEVMAHRGPGMMMDPCYGMGPGMMAGGPYGGWFCPHCGGYLGPGGGNWMGPGMMGPGYGMGPGLMHRGWEVGPQYQKPQKPLEKKDVEANLEGYLRSMKNPNLKLGKVTEKDEYFEVKILTRDNYLIDTIIVDRNTGWMRSAMRGPGRGPGWGYHGYGMGPSMMDPGYYGMGPGMMGPGYQGYGPQYQQQGKPLTEKEVRAMVENYIQSTRNPNLKLGKIAVKDGYFEVEILTKNNALVDKILVDKFTGWMRSIY